MQSFEYTVIPAPARGEKVRGARTGAERFSHALLTEMNRMAALGWEYVRAETLPCEERSGLTSRTTVYHNVLVFRRAVAQPAAQPRPLGAAPTPQAAPVPHAAPVPQAAPAPAGAAPAQAALSAEPPSDWPDAGAVDGAAADTGDYDEPGFSPAGGDVPPFARRPPLAAARGDDSRAVFSGTMPGNRLGPAER